MQLTALHPYHCPSQSQSRSPHIDAGVPACEGGPARACVYVVEMLTGILLLCLLSVFFRDKKSCSTLFLFFFLFSKILLNTHIKSIV